MQVGLSLSPNNPLGLRLGGLVDLIAPTFDAPTYVDETQTLTIPNLSEGGTLVWATSVTGNTPTYSIAGSPPGTWGGDATHETGSIAGVMTLDEVQFPVTDTTPDGTQKLTVYIYDAAGNLSDPFDVEIEVDNTAPVITGVSVTAVNAKFDVDWSTDTGSGTARIVAVPNGDTPPTETEIMAGEKSGGAAADADSGNITVTGTGAQTQVSLTGLTDGTAYDVYLAHEDIYGNIGTASDLNNTFTIFTPAQLFDGVTNGAWIRASEGVTLNSGNVASVSDQSGLGNAFAQTTASEQPALIASPDRFDFDGVDDFLERSDAMGFTGSPGITFIAILSPMPVDGPLTLMQFGASGGSAGQVFGVSVDDAPTGVISTRYSNGNEVTNAAGYNMRTGPSVVSVSIPAGGNGSGGTFRINGGAALSIASGTGSSTNPLNLLNNVSFVSSTFTGAGSFVTYESEIREIIVFEGTPTLSELNGFGDWLAIEHSDVPWSAAT